MGGKMSRNKGKRGEREVIGLLLPVVIEVYEALGLKVPELKRNTLQSDRGGSDIAGLPWLAIEVKWHESVSLGAWWKQTLEQAAQNQVPVLFYRRSRIEWRVRMFVTLGGGPSSYMVPATISVADFLLWFRGRLTQEAST